MKATAQTLAQVWEGNNNFCWNRDKNQIQFYISIFRSKRTAQNTKTRGGQKLRKEANEFLSEFDQSKSERERRKKKNYSETKRKSMSDFSFRFVLNCNTFNSKKEQRHLRRQGDPDQIQEGLVWLYGRELPRLPFSLPKMSFEQMRTRVPAEPEVDFRLCWARRSTRIIEGKPVRQGLSDCEATKIKVFLRQRFSIKYP